MGYASTLEDIRERLSAALDAAQSLPDDPLLATDEHRRSFERSLAALMSSVGEARSYLEIATDPKLDLAQQLDVERKLAKANAIKAAEAVRTAVSLKSALDAERARSKLLERDLKHANQSLRKAEAALRKAFSEHPAELLATYSGGPVRPLVKK